MVAAAAVADHGRHDCFNHSQAGRRRRCSSASRLPRALAETRRTTPTARPPTPGRRPPRRPASISRPCSCVPTRSPGSARGRCPAQCRDRARRSRASMRSPQEMGLPPAEVSRLRSEGFMSFTVGPIRGPRNTAGLTNAALYETAEGAKRSMAHDLRPDVIRAYGPIEGPPVLLGPGRSGRARLDGVRASCRQRLVGAGPLLPHARKPGPRPPRGPPVDGRAGDLRAHEGTVRVMRSPPPPLASSSASP